MAAALTTDSSSRITCLSSIAAAAAAASFLRFCCFLEVDEEEVLEFRDSDGEPLLLTGRCAELRLLVDGCRRGSVSCSVYASEWTKARVSCW